MPIDAKKIQYNALVFTEALPFVRKFGLRLTSVEVRELLAEFVRATRSRGPKPAHYHALQAVVVTGFERFLKDKRQGHGLDVAFMLKRGGERPRDERIAKERRRIASEVLELMDRGNKRDAAIEQIAGKCGRSFEYVRDAYDDWKFLLRAAKRSKVGFGRASE